MSVVALALAAVAAVLVLVGTFTLPGGGTTQAAPVAFVAASGATAAV